MGVYLSDVNQAQAARDLADWLEAARPEAAQDAHRMQAVIGILRGVAAGPDSRSRYEAVSAALTRLVVDANRLCDRNHGGTYEDDCRASIRHARAVMASAREGVWPVGGDGCVTG